MVTPEMPVMTITELGSLWIIAEVPESQSGVLKAGTPVEIRFPSLPGETVSGRLDYVYPELNMETRTVRARVTLDHPPAAIRPEHARVGQPRRGRRRRRSSISRAAR